MFHSSKQGELGLPGPAGVDGEKVIIGSTSLEEYQLFCFILYKYTSFYKDKHLYKTYMSYSEIHANELLINIWINLTIRVNRETLESLVNPERGGKREKWASLVPL